jgi:RNA polymerase sigma-70 factor, ECF subfamily
MTDPGHEYGSACDKPTVSDALASLRQDHREAVIRAYYLHQSLADIAADEHIPEDMVKARLHYALRLLQNTLQEGGGVVA